jgi:thioredoxin-like negative regulator of GroEL
VLAQLLAKSPDARPSARAAAQALQELTDPHPVTLAVASAQGARSFGGTVPVRRTGQVLDVTEKTFRTEVGERSRTVPVIVELWAKGSDLCTRLSPLLERLANEAAGAWVLARIDVDANPGLAKIFLKPAGLSVPAVFAIINRELVDALQGVQVAIPEWYLCQWLMKVVGGLDRPQTAPSDLVVDVTEETFTLEVIERSRTVPVIVELWAKGSDLCTRLSPLLERLANEAVGAWVLARIDVDANPGLAKIFLESAITEPYLRQWLPEVLKLTN